MSGRLDLHGRTALITGAAGGIGRAIAVSLARRGCNVALADLDEAGIEETARLIGNRIRVSRHGLNVADADQVAALPPEILAVHEGLDVLVNNAGVALRGRFDQVSEDEFDWLMSINFQGVVRMSRAFLPLLRQRDQAQLVNISSLFGLVAVPGQTAYSAAKFAVRGFSHALRLELAQEGTRVGVTVVHPGGVRTAIARNARSGSGITAEQVAQGQKLSDKLLRMDPAQAGEIIVRGIERRSARVLVGSDARIVSLLERLMPVGYSRVLAFRSRQAKT